MEKLLDWILIMLRPLKGYSWTFFPPSKVRILASSKSDLSCALLKALATSYSHFPALSQA